MFSFQPDGLRAVLRRLVRFNLRNTTAIMAEARKIPCNRGSGTPAFAHLLGVVLVEPAHHEPLGAFIGWRVEGELTQNPSANLEGRY